MSSKGPRAECASHKTPNDHSNVIRGKRVWTCSHCNKEGPWSEGNWIYYGQIECRHCWRTTVDWVACSDTCMTALGEAHNLK